ncbi:MAG TPA: hypothetical protein VKA68_10945 [bacterium]|nr:hypothetical protein [bacterium]
MTEMSWREQTYQEIYRKIRQHVEERQQTDPRFSKDELCGMLRNAYIDQGNDWGGRGIRHAITISATIAAYEYCLAEWEEAED